MNLKRILISISISTYTFTLAQPQLAPFSSCQSGYQTAPDDNRINITSVYTQLDKAESATDNIQIGQNILRTVLIGDMQDTLSERNSSTDRLATLLVHSRALSFELYDNPVSLCDHVLGSNSTSNHPACPAPQGQVAIGVHTPLPEPAAFASHPYALTTLVNTLRLLDASDPAREMACIDVPLTPYYPNGWFYKLIFWIPVSTCISFLVVQSIASIGAAYRKAKTTKFVRTWASRQRLETSLVGGISGQMFSNTPGLLRFVTPSVGNIILHTQWCAALGMVAVNWPSFSYPFFNQVVWSSLLYNISLTTSDHVDPLSTQPLSIPSPFDTLLFENNTSPLYLNRDSPNNLLDDGNVSHATGLDSLSQVIGLHKDDLYGCCIALALAIAAVLIAASLLLWTLDSLGIIIWRRHANKGREDRSLVKRLSISNNGSDGSVDDRQKSVQELTLPQTNDSSAFKRFQTTTSNNHNNARSGFRRAIWEMRLGGASGGFHWKLLQGNLLRLLLLFHFPITILSVYQLSLSNDGATKVSIAFAVLSLVFIGLAFPIYILIRVSRTPTVKLYDATRTILALGPLYNVFRPGSHLFWGFFFMQNLIEGIIIGAVQVSGTAQSVVLLLVELAGLLMITIWSPWGYGAQMGLLTFLNSVARVITSALLIVLCPAVNINYVAAGWVTYVIFVIQGIVFAVALIIVLTKILEGLLRLFAGLPFIEDAPTNESGLMGAISSIGSKGKNPQEGTNSAVSRTTSRQGILDRQSDIEAPRRNRRKSFKGGSSDYSMSFNTAISPMREQDDDYIMSAWRPTTAFEDSNSSDETHGNYLQRVVDDDSESESDDNHYEEKTPRQSLNQDVRATTPIVPPSLPNSSFITNNDTLQSSQNNEMYSVHSEDTLDTSKRARTRSFSAVVEVFGEQNKNHQPKHYRKDDNPDEEGSGGIGEAK
ncbi:hypothetical protein E3P86_00663 [Wallemia ichthyophaga]|uniref:TRP C-terminal domain-containing protein n=1 Tax=Wallemia ichthyophaga TaxID=245174 RepID=A0A4T0JDK6_WALIC|nr:hypothetical protein E3P86_00663 [Wallemia ichthyophaga]